MTLLFELTGLPREVHKSDFDVRLIRVLAAGSVGVGASSRRVTTTRAKPVLTPF